MSKINVELWKWKKHYEPSHAAYLWLDMEPQKDERPVAVEDTFQDLIRNVPITIITPDGEETRIEAVEDRPSNLLRGFENLPFEVSIKETNNSVICEKKSNLNPYWVFKKDDLLVYAKEIRKKPLFLFPEDLNIRQDCPQVDFDSISTKLVADENSNGESEYLEANIENSDATSEDSIPHAEILQFQKTTKFHVGRKAMEKAYKLYYKENNAEPNWIGLLDFMAEKKVEGHVIEDVKKSGTLITEIILDGKKINRKAFKERFNRMLKDKI